jgi:hypothetical protein
MKASLAEVISKGSQRTRVGRWEWSLANELDMTRRRRNRAKASHTAFPTSTAELGVALTAR